MTVALLFKSTSSDMQQGKSFHAVNDKMQTETEPTDRQEGDPVLAAIKTSSSLLLFLFSFSRGTGTGTIGAHEGVWYNTGLRCGRFSHDIGRRRADEASAIFVPFVLLYSLILARILMDVRVGSGSRFGMKDGQHTQSRGRGCTPPHRP